MTASENLSPCDIKNAVNTSPAEQKTRRRQAISLTRRLEVLKLLNENKTQHEIAIETGISQALVSRIWRRKKLILGDSFENEFHKRKRCKRGKFYDIDRAMTEWYINCRKYDIPVTARMLGRKAKQLSEKLGFIDFQPPYSWLKNWRDKNSIVFDQQLLSEQQIPFAPSENRSLGEVDRFDPDDIYTVAEMGIHHMALPEKVLCQNGKPEQSLQKDWMTLLLACNQTGHDKCRLLVVGKNPLPSHVVNVPCDYVRDSFAWMTSDIFIQWLLNFDKALFNRHRTIVLVLNHSPVHLGEVANDLTNIKLVFVRPDEGVISQPCEHGITHDLKLYYREEYFRTVSLNMKDNRVGLLDVLHMLNKAWWKVSPQTIQSSFWRAGFWAGMNLPDWNPDSRMIEGLSHEETVQFVNHDSGIQCYGMPTDDQICDSVLAVKDDEEENNETDMDEIYGMSGILSNDQHFSGDKEVLQSLASLRCYFEEIGAKDFSKFYSVESLVVGRILFHRKQVHL